MSDEREYSSKPEGGRLASMFGFVTAEDRQRWSQAREANKGARGGMRRGMKSTLNSLGTFVRRRLNSQMEATDIVEAQERFDETHTKFVSERWDSDKQRMVQTVDWQDAHEQQAQMDQEADFTR